jgi:dephospho-CoA kinase
MLVVGLTGNIGSGKSTVARMLEERGVPVIDADVLARDAVAEGSPALAAIVSRWGSRMLAADGSLDRAALRRVVFASAEERRVLESIVHPEIKARREELVEAARARRERVVVCDIPLLFEAGLEKDVDAVLLVDAPREARLERIVRDRGLNRADALAMVDAQWPSDAKRAKSSYIIDNDATLETLRDRVEDTWRSIVRDRLP